MSSFELESLEISGFRRFEHLQIEHLGRVNLLVGKNNVGKTCLLEALRLYASRGSLAIIPEMLGSRDEIGRPYYRRGTDEEHVYIQAVEHLFFGWRAFTDYPRTRQFSIGSMNAPEAQLTVSTEWYMRQVDPETGRTAWRRTQQLALFDQVDDLIPGLEIRLGKESLVSWPIYRIFDRPASFVSWPTQVREIPHIFVSAGGLENDQIASLWDKVSMRAGEEDLLAGLRIISPDVERVNLLGQGEHSDSRIPVVKVSAVAEPLPLRSLGEGMNRLLGIILALVNAKDGLLIVDEIESGLHYTVHRDLWNLVFEVAKRLNVQVFATTHSWDCVEGFQHCAEQQGTESGILIRLENRQGHIVPILFDRERLSIATRQDIKVL